MALKKGEPTKTLNLVKVFYPWKHAELVRRPANDG
jgi:hypothetical protein